MKVLIAEDDLVTAQVSQRIVERLGYETVWAKDGAQAWEIFQKTPVPLLLTDWQMPSLDGLELCQKIRASQKTEYTYIILVTAAFTEKEDYRKAMKAGVDDFLLKPYEPDDLRIRMHVAERILNFFRQLHELKQLLPICSYCKSIRNDQNYWETIETYFQHHVGADFSHGICPRCYAQHVQPDLDRLKEEKETE